MGAPIGPQSWRARVGDARVKVVEAPARPARRPCCRGSCRARGAMSSSSPTPTSMLERGAAKALARHFHEPSVGAVVGRLRFYNRVKRDYEESLYWKYETVLKYFEGKQGCVLGANGGLYAVRRLLFPPAARHHHHRRLRGRRSASPRAAGASRTSRRRSPTRRRPRTWSGSSAGARASGRATGSRSALRAGAARPAHRVPELRLRVAQAAALAGPVLPRPLACSPRSLAVRRAARSGYARCSRAARVLRAGAGRASSARAGRSGAPPPSPTTSSR